MHIPGTKKTQKRKASTVSVGDDTRIPAEPKQTKREPKKSKPNRNVKKDTTTPEPLSAAAAATSSPTPAPSPTTMSPSHRVDSATDSPPTSTTLTHASTDPTPRRSSRIKNSLHTVAHTWDKARPYIERINGTIMPLEPQAGAEVYYKRDGVKGV